MIALDRWLEINNKTPFIEDYMQSSNIQVLNLKELKVDILKCISPFIYGKVQLTKTEIDYIDSIFKTKYQLESFFKLYKELYLNKQVKVIPVVSLWNNFSVEQYINIATGGKIRLFCVEIPVDKAVDNLFIELYIKNYLNIFNNFDKLPLNYNNSIYTFSKPTLNIIDSSLSSPLDFGLGMTSGIEIGEYLNTDDSILIKIGDKIKYWDYYNGHIDVDLTDIKLLSQILVKPGITDEKLNKKNILNIKRSYLLDLLDRNKDNSM